MLVIAVVNTWVVRMVVELPVAPVPWKPFALEEGRMARTDWQRRRDGASVMIIPTAEKQDHHSDGDGNSGGFDCLLMKFNMSLVWVTNNHVVSDLWGTASKAANHQFAWGWPDGNDSIKKPGRFLINLLERVVIGVVDGGGD